MNRHERRAARKQGRWRVGSVVNISVGHLQERDLNYGTAVSCFVCSTPHFARGLARITDNGGNTDIPLCERCVGNDVNTTTNVILKKYWGSPDLKINDGGKVSVEQYAALVERQGAVEH